MATKYGAEWINPDTAAGLCILREDAALDVSDGGERIPTLLLDAPEDVLWDTLAILTAGWTMQRCAAEAWWQYAMRCTLVATLVRVDAKSACAFLGAWETIFSEDPLGDPDENGEEAA